MGEQRRDLIGPVFLVLLGVVLLLNTLGLLPWRSWFEAWRYWPVLLILAGAAFLIDRNTRRSFHLLGWLIALSAIGAVITAFVYYSDGIGLGREQPLPASRSSSLATSGPVDQAQSATVALNLHRGNLTLAAKPGAHLLSAHSSYDWPSDRPSLTYSGGTEARVDFNGGRRAFRFGWRGMDGTPRYDLVLGRPGVDHTLSLDQNSGTSELNLSGLRLTQCVFDLNSGRCRAAFGANEASCRRFSIELNSGELELTDLGGLGAERYRIDINSGDLSGNFGALKPGVSLDLTMTLNSGTVALTLPPGIRLEVDLEINSGTVRVFGQRYNRGTNHFTVGAGETRGRLSLNVNSGDVRID